MTLSSFILDNTSCSVFPHMQCRAGAVSYPSTCFHLFYFLIFGHGGKNPLKEIKQQKSYISVRSIKAHVSAVPNGEMTFDPQPLQVCCHVSVELRRGNGCNLESWAQFLCSEWMLIQLIPVKEKSKIKENKTKQKKKEERNVPNGLHNFSILLVLFATKADEQIEEISLLIQCEAKRTINGTSPPMVTAHLPLMLSQPAQPASDRCHCPGEKVRSIAPSRGL